ncbi:hypothetical protein [Acidimangrovimonas pyrenivorans]
MRLTSTGAISVVVTLGAIALLLMAIAFGYDENPGAKSSGEQIFNREARKAAIPTDVAAIACEHIDDLPEDYLGGWVIGYWSGIILHGADEALRKQRPHLSRTTPRMASSRVKFFCLASPRASIGEASYEALMSEIRRR